MGLFAVVASQGCGATASRSGFSDPDAAPREPQDSFGYDASPGTDGGEEAGVCAGAFVKLERSPVYMLVIMDGSGSMDDPLVPGGATGLKWQAARDAMIQFIDGAKNSNDTGFGLGLFLFDGTKGVQEFQTHDVAIDHVDAQQAMALKGRILGSTPNGGTPLKRAIEGQLGVLSTFSAYPPLRKNGKRVLVVMTDGVPDGDATIQAQLKQECIDLVDAARSGSSSITTFAVGIGEPSSSPGTFDEQFMGRLAVAGGAAKAGCDPTWSEASPAGVTPCHFQVTPGSQSAGQIQSQLFAAIEAIRGAASNCEFPLEISGDATGVPDPTKVNIAFTDGTGKKTSVPKDPKNGWSFDNPSSPKAIRLNGTACDQARSESNGTLEVELGCSTRVN
jgi:hypothetical protein